jgi:phage/plasmid primase-like uncharacterized protein
MADLLAHLKSDHPEASFTRQHKIVDVTISAQAIALARRIPIEKVIAQHGIKLRGKVERVGPCPRCGGTDRFSINTGKRVWNCRRCARGGDVIALTQFLDGVDFRRACSILSGETMSRGTGRPQRHIEYDQNSCDDEQDIGAEDDERQQRDKARFLYRSSQPATRTPAESYLRSRGITMPLPTTVRFLPPLNPDHHPAMIVPYGLAVEPEPGRLDIAEAAISAVQLTLLKPDGTGKVDVKPNKRTIASPAGMPMVLAPMNDLLGLAICEGVEDALSAHQSAGLGAWASGGASFMPKLAAAVPDYVEAVIICAHDDKAGQRYARALADALDARGVEIYAEGLLS